MESKRLVGKVAVITGASKASALPLPNNLPPKARPLSLTTHLQSRALIKW